MGQKRERGRLKMARLNANSVWRVQMCEREMQAEKEGREKGERGEGD